MMLKGGWHHGADVHLTWAEWQLCHAVLPQLLASFLRNYHIVVYNEKVFVLSFLSAACRHGLRSNWSPPPGACRASSLPRPMMAWWASSSCREASPQPHCRLLTQAACMLRYYRFWRPRFPNNPGTAVDQMCTSHASVSPPQNSSEQPAAI